MKTDNVQNNTAVPSNERLQQLKELFPECISEGVFDTEKLPKILNLNKVIGGGKKR